LLPSAAGGGDQPRRDCWDRQRLSPTPGPTVQRSAGSCSAASRMATCDGNRRPHRQWPTAQSRAAEVGSGSWSPRLANGCSCRGLKPLGCSGPRSCWGTFGGIGLSVGSLPTTILPLGPTPSCAGRTLIRDLPLSPKHRRQRVRRSETASKPQQQLFWAVAPLEGRRDSNWRNSKRTAGQHDRHFEATLPRQVVELGYQRGRSERHGPRPVRTCQQTGLHAARLPSGNFLGAPWRGNPPTRRRKGPYASR